KVYREFSLQTCGSTSFRLLCHPFATGRHVRHANEPELSPVPFRSNEPALQLPRSSQRRVLLPASASLRARGGRGFQPSAESLFHVQWWARFCPYEPGGSVK